MEHLIDFLQFFHVKGYSSLLIISQTISLLSNLLVAPVELINKHIKLLPMNCTSIVVLLLQVHLRMLRLRSSSHVSYHLVCHWETWLLKEYRMAYLLLHVSWNHIVHHLFLSLRVILIVFIWDAFIINCVIIYVGFNNWIDWVLNSDLSHTLNLLI
jgi:hypothetical protein